MKLREARRGANQKPKREGEARSASLIARVIAHPFLSVAVTIGLAVVGWVFFTPGGASSGGRVAVLSIIEPSNPKPSELGSDLGPPWGPPRKIFHCNLLAECESGDKVSLNSTVGNPEVGDERFFLAAKIEGKTGPVRDLLEAEPGDILVTRLFFANDARIPLRPHSELIAEGLSARIEVPRDPASEIRLYGWLSADNANPGAVFDTLTLRSELPVVLHLVGGTVRIVNKAHPNGLALGDSLADDGVKLGYRRLDGRLGGCMCEAGYVIAKFVVA
jgi:hypothetical protein